MSEKRTAQEAEVLREFGDRLRALRIERGITQEELAAEAGLSRSYYTEIETGKRNVALLNLHKLAECLKIELKDLFLHNK